MGGMSTPSFNLPGAVDLGALAAQNAARARAEAVSYTHLTLPTN
jgi:hypothetical protein